MTTVKEDKFKEIKKFQKDLDQCMKCGFCSFWCPVYQEEKVESAVARGKNMLIRGLVNGDLEITEELAKKINKCTLCMTCTENCPAKTQIPPVIMAARADIMRARGIKFPYSFVYQKLLPRRVLFGNVVRMASWFQGVFLPKTDGSVRHLSFFLSALGKGRNIPSIAPKFLRQMMPEVNKPPAGVETKFKVGYFTGCMTDFVFPDLGKHIIEFLTRNGVEVIMPKAQGCCGAPVYMGAGDFDTGRKMADVNLKAFGDLDYIITDCATCGSGLKEYHKFLADTPEREKSYDAFGKRVKDITEFLVDVLKLPASAYKAAPEVRGKKVTWHDPCHFTRHMNIKTQPRQILNSIEGIEFVEMPNANRCCGMAGAFSIYYYDVSKKIADKKIDFLASTKADVVATGCPGCEIQLIDGIQRHKLPVKVMHIMELVE